MAPPPTAARAEKVVVGLERLIPIEATYVRTTGEATPPQLSEKMERAVAGANQLFSVTGIQFYLRSVGSVLAPDLATWNWEYDPPIQWDNIAAGSKIKDDLEAFFGKTMWPGRDVTDRTSREDWLTLGVLQYGRSDAIYVMIGAFPGSGDKGPPGSRTVFMALPDIAIGHGDLGHELGHHLGLNHPWEIPGYANPRTQAPLQMTDYWDLAYCAGTSAGNPPTVFASQGAALAGCPAGTGPMRMKMGTGKSPPANSCDGQAIDLDCTWAPGTGAGGGYGATVVHHTDARLVGSLSFVGTSGAPADRGANLMGYMDAFGRESGLSPSQIQIMRDTLRYDHRVNIDTGPSCPGGPYCVRNTANLGKPALGAATSSRPPTYKLDVNGDGLRDLVVWSVASDGAWGTNNATYTVWYAPTFSCAQSANFGRADDIPVMMDFDGDGRFDQGLYRPDQAESGLRNAGSIWYQCPSEALAPAVSATCPTPPATAGRLRNCVGGATLGYYFGEQRDVPLAGLKLGATPQVAVFRAETSTFYWGPASNPFPFSSVQIYSVVADDPHSLLLDDYDGDGLIDFGTHEVRYGQAAVSLSSGGWGASSKRYFQFPTAYDAFGIPNPDPGTAILSARSAAVAVVGARHQIPGTTPPLYTPRTVGTLTLWDPAQGTACTVADATANVYTGNPFVCDSSGSAVGTTTTLGGVGDVPLGGLRLNGPYFGIATLAYIHFDVGGAVTLERRERTTSSTTALPSRALTGTNARAGAAFVADMGQDGTTGTGTGADGLPELLIQGATPGTWQIYWSNTDYATHLTITTGSMMSHMLL